jgi:chromosome segregation ATPase
MANPVPHQDAHRNGADNDRLGRLLSRNVNGGREKSSQDTPLPSGLSPWERRDHRAEPEPAAEPPESEVSEMDQLKLDKAELRRSVDELQQSLEEMRQLEDTWARQQREYEALLEEKSEVIRTLHQKLQELQETSCRPSVPAPREEELLSLHDELEHERRQLKEDEDALMQQMRDMELQMARERAELARQRNEVQRLHIEVHHELELAARDATLRERLAPLQRRLQDTMHRKGAPPTQSLQHNGPVTPPPPTEPPQRPAPNQSGVFRRLFGG